MQVSGVGKKGIFCLGKEAAAHFLGIGRETGKRTVFLAKNGFFIGEFESFEAGNESLQKYTIIV
jgi:hypothetical protein